MRKGSLISAVLVFSVMMVFSACGGGGGSTPSTPATTGSGGNTGGGNSVTTGPAGTLVLSDGAAGVAVIHIEDTSGNLLSSTKKTDVAAAGAVTVVAEPPDFSQGLVISGQTVQTLNTATTTPAVVSPNVALSGAGAPLAAAIINDSSFSFVQAAQWTGFDGLCFTGGLHQTTDASGNPVVPASGPATEISEVMSPDGTGLAAWNTDSQVDIYSVKASLTPHELQYQQLGADTAATPKVNGRGAMAWSPDSTAVLAGGPDGTLTSMVGLAPQTLPNFSAGNTVGTVTQITLPGAPAVSSIAFAPNGNFAVVATSAGLFVVTMSSTGALTVASGPNNATYTGSDGNSYTLGRTQSVAITQDGKFLAAVTDQPSTTNGTVVVMPVSTTGTIGTVGLTAGGLNVTDGMDDLWAH